MAIKRKGIFFEILPEIPIWEMETDDDFIFQSTPPYENLSATEEYIKMGRNCQIKPKVVNVLTKNTASLETLLQEKIATDTRGVYSLPESVTYNPFNQRNFNSIHASFTL